MFLKTYKFILNHISIQYNLKIYIFSNNINSEGRILDKPLSDSKSFDLSDGIKYNLYGLKNFLVHFWWFEWYIS